MKPLRGLVVSAMALALSACVSSRPPVPQSNESPDRPLVPPPPPPLEADPHGRGPAELPEQISSFIRKIGADGTFPVVTVYPHDDSGLSVASPQTLSNDDAMRTLVYLSSPFAYSKNHPLCTEEGIGLRVEYLGTAIDLTIGIVCRHVHLAETGEEIGVLSRAGQEYFKLLAERVSSNK